MAGGESPFGMRVTYMTSVNHTLVPDATVVLRAYNFAPNPRKPAQIHAPQRLAEVRPSREIANRRPILMFSLTSGCLSAALRSGPYSCYLRKLPNAVKDRAISGWSKLRSTLNLSDKSEKVR